MFGWLKKKFSKSPEKKKTGNTIPQRTYKEFEVVPSEVRGYRNIFDEDKPTNNGVPTKQNLPLAGHGTTKPKPQQDVRSHSSYSNMFQVSILSENYEKSRALSDNDNFSSESSVTKPLDKIDPVKSLGQRVNAYSNTSKNNHEKYCKDVINEPEKGEEQGNNSKLKELNSHKNNLRTQNSSVAVVHPLSVHGDINSSIVKSDTVDEQRPISLSATRKTRVNAYDFKIDKQIDHLYNRNHPTAGFSSKKTTDASTADDYNRNNEIELYNQRNGEQDKTEIVAPMAQLTINLDSGSNKNARVNAYASESKKPSSRDEPKPSSENKGKREISSEKTETGSQSDSSESDDDASDSESDDEETAEFNCVRDLLTDAYHRGEISSEDGIIPKGQLRALVRLKLKRKELAVKLDAHNIGQLLAKHGFLAYCRKELKVFRIKIEKLPPMEEKEPEPPIDPLVFDYEGTEMFLEGSENKEKTMEYCLICQKIVDETISKHMETNHTKEDLTGYKPCYDPIFDVTFEVDEMCMFVEITVQNISAMKLKLMYVEMIDNKDKDFTYKCDYFIFLLPKEIIKFKFERSLFKDANVKYYVRLLCEEDFIRYLTTRRITIQKTLNDVIRSKRAEKERQAENEWTHIPYRFRRLDDYFPDQNLLALFTEDFKVKPRISNLKPLELIRFRQLVDFAKGGKQLTLSNYVGSLTLLLEIEDLYINHLLLKFMIPNVQVSQPSEMMYFIDISKVVDFPEKLEEGDTIVLQKTEENLEKCEEYCYQIAKIANQRVYFEKEERKKLDISFNYDVRFRQDRTCIQMENEALATVETSVLRGVIFPELYGSSMDAYRMFNFEWCSPFIATNAEQKQAVTNIVRCTSYPAPYIIFGPPGTGKTATVVEAIAQIFKLKPEAKILVTAPSNFACDEIATRLLKYVPAVELYRYYSKSVVRRFKEMDDDLLMISNLSSGNYKIPMIKVLKKYRIILATVVQSGRLALNGLEKNYFEYIFLDECGSSTEPSSLIPIAGSISRKERGTTMVVLTGDPKQLGPVVTCDFANIVGLGKSLLERLMDSELYQPVDGKYNEKIITKLLQNFRSHPVILHTSNEMFYNGELLAKADPEIINFALNWKLLPNKKFPMIFHAVNGETKRLANSFSLFNEQEIKEVTFYIDQIRKFGINGIKVPLNEIGVVSPYRLQCQKIQERIRNFGWKGIQVGSAEQYQGKEKMVVIISTVRSNTNTAGFLGSAKRLNVVITRAKGLLIIIGNPNTLRLDANWHKLLGYCKENNATKGRKFDLPPMYVQQMDKFNNPIQSYEDSIIHSLTNMIHQFERMALNLH